MRRRRRIMPAAGVALAASLLVLTGCPKQPEVGDARPTAPSVAQDPPRPPVGSRPGEVSVVPPPVPREATVDPAPAVRADIPPPAPGPVPRHASPLKDVFFDYDRSLLTDDAKRLLNENAAWLKATPRVQVTIEGHCDERGSTEYNLALGERRAKAIRDYLAAAGIEPGRMRTVSYGKERPFVTGHDESAWRWNRRAHFVVTE